MEERPVTGHGCYPPFPGKTGLTGHDNKADIRLQLWFHALDAEGGVHHTINQGWLLP
jgi:hypothetical protein